MRAFRLFSVLAALMVLGTAGSVLAVQVSSDGDRGDANRILTAVFNDSGSDLTSGTVVIWDTGVDDPADSGFGAWVTTTTTADSNLVAGVVQSSTILNQGVGTICVYGPIAARFADGTDGATETAGTAVGTTTVAGQFGTGTGLGVLLEAGQAGEADNALVTIFVNPSNAE